MPSRSQIQCDSGDSSPTCSKLEAVKRVLEVIDIESEEDQHYIVDVIGINSIQRILKISSYTLEKMRKDSILTTGDIDQFETAILWMKAFKSKNSRAPTPQDICRLFTEEMWENFEPEPLIDDSSGNKSPPKQGSSSAVPIKIEDGSSDIDSMVESEVPSEIRTGPSNDHMSSRGTKRKKTCSDYETITESPQWSSNTRTSIHTTSHLSLSSNHEQSTTTGNPGRDIKSNSFPDVDNMNGYMYMCSNDPMSTKGSETEKGHIYSFSHGPALNAFLEEEITFMLKRRSKQFGSDDPKVIQWRIRFHQLEKFKEKYGHYEIPTHNPYYKGLLHWLDQERHSIEDGEYANPVITLPRSRRRMFFESIGILDFSKPDDEDRHWDHHFKALVKFKLENGHCMVPKIYRTLYEWLEGQRNDYAIFVKSEDRNSKMTVQRYFCLEAVGLIWHINLDEEMEEWVSQYNSLKSFKEEHHHCNVSWADPRHRELGFWVTAQRVMKRCRSEGVQHVDFFKTRHCDLLNKIGFQWTEWTNPFLNNFK